MLVIDEFCNAEERCWETSNGATSRTLVLINKTGRELEKGVHKDIRVGTLDKGNYSFIFLSPGKMDKTVGLFTCEDYGYHVVEEVSPENAEIYSASSVGGPGNSESKFGLYEVGTVLAVHPYKYRKGDIYYRLTCNGWEDMGRDCSLADKEINWL